MPQRLKKSAPAPEATTTEVHEGTLSAAAAPIAAPMELVAATAQLKSTVDFSPAIIPMMPVEIGQGFLIGSINVGGFDGIMGAMMQIANQLHDIMEAQRLYTTFETYNKKTNVTTTHHHPHVEAWQALAMLTGCIIREVSNVYTPELNGFEAKAEVIRLLDGMRIGFGSGFCDFTEKEKTYAAKSMAMTRAISKAMKNTFGHIMKVAGYQTTPKEELEDLDGTTVDGSTKVTPMPENLPALAQADAIMAEIYAFGNSLNLANADVDAIFEATFNNKYPDLVSGKEIYKATLQLAVNTRENVTATQVAQYMKGSQIQLDPETEALINSFH